MAYNILKKQVIPIFSGSVDTLINRIDVSKAVEDSFKITLIKKVAKMYKKKGDLNQIEAALLDELKECKQALESKNMMYGLWSVMGQSGSIPHSREGGQAVILNNEFYLFGGFSRDLFGDFRVYDVGTKYWRILPQDSLIGPGPRYSHTMMAYDRKIIVFGGAGPYMPAIKMRVCYNDVHIFDTDSEQWLKEPEIEGAPAKRMSHCASIFGGFMLVHGGYNTE